MLAATPRIQDELARRAPAGQCLVGAGGLRQGVGSAQVHAQLAPRDALEEVGPRLVEHVRPAQAVHEPGADDRVRSAQEAPGGDLVLSREAIP